MNNEKNYKKPHLTVEQVLKDLIPGNIYYVYCNKDIAAGYYNTKLLFIEYRKSYTHIYNDGYTEDQNFDDVFYCYNLKENLFDFLTLEDYKNGFRLELVQ